MDSRAKKLKSLIKNVAPKATYGTNPRDPWSARANIFENSPFNKYILSRGLQPQFLSRGAKIAHSKSASFLAWAKNHQFEDVGHLATQGEGGRTRERKNSLEKSAHSYKEIKTPHGPGSHNEEAEVCGVCGQNPCICDDSHGFVKETRASPAVKLSRAWDRQQQKSAASRERAKELLKKKPMDSKPDAKGSQTPVVTPESIQVSEEIIDFNIDPLTGEMKDERELISSSYNKKMKPKEIVMIEEEMSQPKIDKFHKKLDKLVHSTFGKSSMEKKMKEDVGDAKAAVHADGMTAAVDQMQAETKRQMSKSARMIKALYKKKGMMEDLHDHEKEDKSVATYGKKPKFEKGDKDDNIGEKKPQAAAVLTGGKTLTGTERDTVEIDPMMRNRPGQPDVTKKDDKKDGKDKKKEEKK
jgi:hypothetical protein